MFPPCGSSNVEPCTEMLFCKQAPIVRVNDQVRFFDTSARKDCNVIHGRLDKHAAKRRLGRVRSALKQSSGLDGICSKTYGTIPSHTPDMSTFHRVVHCGASSSSVFSCVVAQLGSHKLLLIQNIASTPDIAKNEMLPVAAASRHKSFHRNLTGCERL